MDYDLKKLQSTIMIIAKEIKRVCNKNNINYVMYAGTVLGAVRHKGFIPWDDDMDFAMMREDYNRFIECCKTDLSENFIILEWRKNDTYSNFFLKVMLKDTVAMSKGNSTTNYPKGIYIDIFPLDRIPENTIIQTIQRIKSYFLLHLIWQKENYNWDGIFSGWKKVANNILNLLAKPMNREKLITQCELVMMRYNQTNSKYYSCICGVYGYVKETYPCEWIDRPISLQFEGETFNCIAHTNEYLIRLYGDYMKLPPPEKRRTHSFIKVDFGPY